MRRVFAAVVATEARLAMTFLVAMVALIFFGALARMAGHPVNWAVDAATCLFAWACFLAADVAWRGNRLMAIDLVAERLPTAWQRWLRRLNLGLIASFLVYVAVAGSWLAWTSRGRSFQGIPEISYSWVTASMPFGALLLLATTVLKMRDEFKAPAGD